MTSSPVAPSPEIESVEPAPVTTKPERETHWDWRHPSGNTVLVLVLLLVAVRVGLIPLHDNSFLTHLATGRLILDRGSVPSHDPYSFTAFGDAWTVQSWGASVIYAGLERLVGLIGIRILHATLAISLVLILWRLTRPASGLIARLLPVGLACAMGSGLWVGRPLLFGAVGLALVLLAAEDGLDPRWLVPVMWIWVNTHGSFPLGIGVLVLLGFGRWLDERTRPVVEIRALVWATVGTLAAAINPVGPRLLVFPLRLLTNTSAFAEVEEWQPPRFQYGTERFFAAQLGLVVLVVLLRHRRWRVILPLVVFAAAALTSARNILPASIVLTPILAVSLSGLGSITGERRPRLLRPVAIALVVLLGLVAVDSLAQPSTTLGAYPVKAAQWMRGEGLLDTSDRVVARDWVGNYLEFQYGPKVRVFVDDRVDMYPMSVIDDFSTLLDKGADFQEILTRRRATAVLWQRQAVLGRWLHRSSHWKVVYEQGRWLVAVPSGR